MKVNNRAVNNLTDLKLACHKIVDDIQKSTKWSTATIIKYFKYPKSMDGYQKEKLAKALGTTIDIVDRVIKMQIESEGTK